LIKHYIVERRSWILLFVVIHGLILFISYVDPQIPFMPILYIAFLSALVFILFLAIRYNKETKFYKSMEAWENDLDLAALAHSSSPFEKIVEASVINQTERLKQRAEYNQMLVEQEKDELLSWIHEVKTPLSAMRLIVDRVDDEAIRSQIMYEWLRIHLLLDQQLHQKRIPFMENDLYIELIQIKSLITKEMIELQSWCMQKGIGFELNLEVQEVLSDAKWLAFIMRQLLTNAVKYSHSSDIVISSYLRGEQAVVEVKDTGRGIDARDLPRIFEKGYTSTAMHQDHAATGMGLYLAEKAAKLLLIHIEVQSEPGAGTTFSLVFPKHNPFDQITGM